MSGPREAALAALQEAAKKAENAEHIRGGRRCALKESEWLDDWWVGYSPRNGDGADVEGNWEDWVALATAILERDKTLRSRP